MGVIRLATWAVLSTFAYSGLALSQSNNEGYFDDPCLKDRKTCPQIRRPSPPPAPTVPNNTRPNHDHGGGKHHRPNKPPQKHSADKRTKTYQGSRQITCYQRNKIYLEFDDARMLIVERSSFAEEYSFRDGWKGKKEEIYFTRNEMLRHGIRCTVD